MRDSGSGLLVQIQQALHPAGEGLLLGRARGLGSVHIPALLRSAILAELEFAFDALDGNAKADDAREQGAAKTVGHRTPTTHESRFMRRDEIGEKRLFAWVVVDERERAVGVNGDVVPRGHREFFDIKSWRNVTVRPREDDKSFTSGERLPVGIGFGEVTLNHAMLSFILDNKRKMGCRGARARLLAARRTTKNWTENRRERIRPHGFKQDAAIVNLIEFG